MDNHEHAKLNNFFNDLGLSGVMLIITAVISLVSSVLGSIFTSGIIFSICDKAFYISLSALIIQLLIDIRINKKLTKGLVEFTKCTECIVFPNEAYKADEYLNAALKNNKVRQMLVICYGTSKFGGTITTSSPDISKKVIVCSPKVTILGNRADKNRLESAIEEMGRCQNIKVIQSKIPPTIRGCVLLTEDGRNDKDSVFCMMQPYYIYGETTRTATLFRGYKESPTFIATDPSCPIIRDLSKAFIDEYIRLEKANIEYTRP